MHTNDSEVSMKRYKYNGKERDDETGLDYYGARYYASWLCRFVSVDPLKDSYPFQNSFAYAANSPVTMTDVNGEGPEGGEGDPKKEKTLGESVMGFYVSALKSGINFYQENKEVIQGSVKIVQGAAMAYGGGVMIAAGVALSSTGLGSVIGIPLQFAGVATISLGVGQAGLGMAQISAELQNKKNEYGGLDNYGGLVGKSLEEKGLLKDGEKIGELTYDGFSVASSFFSAGAAFNKGNIFSSAGSFSTGTFKSILFELKIEDFMKDGFYDGIPIHKYNEVKEAVLDAEGKISGIKYTFELYDAEGNVVGDGSFNDFINHSGDRIQNVERNIYNAKDKVEGKINQDIRILEPEN